MKVRLLIVWGLLIVPLWTNAQGLDRKLEKMATELATKLDTKSVGKVAIWGFVQEEKKDNPLGALLTEDFSIHLMDKAESFSVLERYQLTTLLKEHGLNDDGYINEKTAKELGKFVAADAVVVGSYTILRTEIKLRIKVLDTETALQITGISGSLPITPNIARKLGRL